MTNELAALSDMTHKTLSEFQQTECPKTKSHFFDHASKLLDSRDYDCAIVEATQAIQDLYHCDLVQLLDLRLRAHMAKNNYKDAFNEALEMQKVAPGSYYGYHRAAQIYFACDEYIEGLKVYLPALNNVKQQDQIEMLRKSLDNAEDVLDQAAVHLEERWKYDAAHEIANALIESLPASPTGYLRAGNLFQMQCKPNEAIKVYDQGVAAVDSDSKHLLIDRKNDVEKQLERMTCSDFITDTPEEIAFRIIKHFYVYGCLQLMTVSKGWRKRILECPDPWRIVGIHRTGMHPVHQEAKKFVRKISLHGLRTFEVEDVEYWMGLVRDGRFQNLVAFELDDCSMPRDDAYFKLGHAGDKLTCLKLRIYYRSEPLVPLHMVLEFCPNLKHLEYRQDEENLAQPGSALLPKTPTMITQLGIESCNTIYSDVDYEKLFELFPYLIHLCVSRTNPSEASAIIKHCADLRTLHFGNGGHDCTECDSPMSTRSSLQRLSIAYQNLDPGTIAAVMAPHINTIELLELTYPTQSVNGNPFNRSNRGETQSWRSIPDISSSTLKSLYLSIGNDCARKQWIEDCPVLADVTLVDMQFMDDTIFNGLKRIQSLRRLQLHKCKRLTRRGIYNFVNEIATRNPELHTLSFSKVAVTDPILLSVSKIKTLHAFNIHDCRYITKNGIEQFVTSIKKEDGSLEFLGFGTTDTLSNQFLTYIVQALPRLRKLRLESLDELPRNAALWHDIEKDISKTLSASRDTKISVQFMRCSVSLYWKCDCAACKSSYQSLKFYSR